MKKAPMPHRKNYILALPMGAVLGGLYLIVDTLVAVPGELLLSLLACAALFLVLFEFSVSAISWLERQENSRRRPRNDEVDKNIW